MKKKLLLGLSIMAGTAFAQEIRLAGNVIMSSSDFGLTTNIRSWEAGSCRIIQAGKPRKIVEDYQMLTGKRSHCTNKGTETAYYIINKENDTLRLVMRKYSDGYAFRYELDDIREGETVKSETTRYHVPTQANRWMQQYDGPGYEHFFPLCKGGMSPEGEKITQWGYPALFELTPSGDYNSADKKQKGVYILISDSYDPVENCGTMLTNSPDDRNTYAVKMFDELPLAELADGTPMTGKAWQSAWHVIAAGSLADVVGTTLVTDVAKPCKYTDTSWIEPGVSSWIYWAYNHGSQEYSILKDYVDLAVDMGWRYTLVDAEWDVMRGGDIEGLCEYAVSKGVKPLIWYNSTTNWTGKWAPTPQGRLNNDADREAEFSRIAAWGVTGVKIDFFRDDTRETTKYYWQLLDAAQRNRLLVNFHGGTIPHGWQRTYPNVMTCEGVYGAEWYNNNGIMTNKAACHNATLPFTRNVIGPMDYTPGTFTDSQHPHITTDAHELALPILFESSLQHMPDRPSAYRNLPKEARELLGNLPAAWDDTKLIAGYPGKYVVLARRKGDVWYIAGVNGTEDTMDVTIDLKELGIKGKATTLFADGNATEGKKLVPMDISTKVIKDKIDVIFEPRGGFAAYFSTK